MNAPDLSPVQRFLVNARQIALARPVDAVKQLVMFLYCRGLLPAGTVMWLVRVLKLRAR